MSSPKIIMRTSGAYSDYSVLGVYKIIGETNGEKKTFQEWLDSGVLEEIPYAELWTSWWDEEEKPLDVIEFFEKDVET